MLRNPPWRGVLVFVLCLCLAQPLQSQGYGYQGPGHTGGQAAAIIAGGVAGIVAVVFVGIHFSKKKTVSGCVSPDEGGMSITDEADKQLYALFGNTTDVKVGHRMKLHGHKVNEKVEGAKTVAWEVQKVDRDLGSCNQ